MAAPKKVLVVTVTKGFRHSSIPTAERVIKQLGDKTGDFTVDYARTDAELAEKTAVAALAGYDAVVFANTTGDLPLADVPGFLKWLEGGRGFVGMHSATDTFRGHKPLHPFTVMINGEFRTHKEQAAVEAWNGDPTFPSNQHSGASFKVFDEIYILDAYQRKAVRALLDLDQHPNSKLPGHYPISWARLYGQGRVWYTSLGHREDIGRRSEPEGPPQLDRRVRGLPEAHPRRHPLGRRVARVNATPQSLKAKLPDAEAEGFRPLFNGEDLAGWKLRNPSGLATWSAQNGMLVNEIPEKEHGTDLLTEKSLDLRGPLHSVPGSQGSQLGLLPARPDQVQILDDAGTGATGTGNNGGIYSVKGPSQNVSKPTGQWQQAEVTIKGNRITVVLNGVKVQDNVEVTKGTGGQLDENHDQPGPILLQGDHGAVAFRNIRLKAL